MATTTATRGRSVSSTNARSSVAERAARGRQVRNTVSRSRHGDWTAIATRTDPRKILTAQERTRVPDLLPIRHGRMAASPFAFYRGAAAVMAADLADEPATGLDVQLCGDAHLANFGAFADPGRELVFDLNDFDETHPGPFEWDVKRLVASLEVAARERGFDRKLRREIVTRASRSYRTAMQEFASMRLLDVWHSRLGIADFERRWGAEASARHCGTSGRPPRKQGRRTTSKRSAS